MDSLDHGQEVFAVIRVEIPDSDETPPEDLVNLEKVMTSEILAKAEVDRLNGSTPEENCYFTWQKTQLFGPSGIPPTV